ncbi:hypothetical protein DOTSEDRAFT_71941 [Dothistroma septosporum NZE10]|uniref:Uncharacterized protein n=1 Tax=Dothistroma septosporum (strain NZE10 / CBS 128990) TaxID=675120 RepID=N1PPH6_DOTSN|nr:hypothetical protein DOTSEDRAFT_71941 [Dothistroma septosporum NZE10]
MAGVWSVQRWSTHAAVQWLYSTRPPSPESYHPTQQSLSSPFYRYHLGYAALVKCE